MRVSSHLLRVLSVLGLALTSLYLSAAASAEDACRQSQSWVESHRAELPTTYEGLSAYPVNQRRAIFRAATPETRSEFWRSHLEQYVADHPALTEKQVEVIQQALRLATVEQFGVIDRSKSGARPPTPDLVDLDKEIRAAFEPAQAGEIFAVLGKPGEGGVAGLVIVRHGSPGVSDAGTIQCSCSSSSDWCSGSYSCATANCGQTGGCGTLWLYTCDGVCYTQNDD